MCSLWPLTVLFFFFFNAPATTEIYTLSLHDALPIFTVDRSPAQAFRHVPIRLKQRRAAPTGDEGLGAVDEADQQRRQDQRAYQQNDRAEFSHTSEAAPDQQRDQRYRDIKDIDMDVPMLDDIQAGHDKTEPPERRREQCPEERVTTVARIRCRAGKVPVRWNQGFTISDK